MPLTLEDSMEFMKKDKEERTQERERDKEEIREMISSGVKAEVEMTMKPMQERQEILDNVQNDLIKQFKVIFMEVQNIQNQLRAATSNSQHFPDLPQSGQSCSIFSESTERGRVQQHDQLHDQEQSEQHQQFDQDQRKEEIISLGRRTVGLHRIDKADLERMRQVQYGGASTEEEEMLFAAKEFLQCEIKLSREEIDRLEIENIFTPAKEDPQCLYVTFKHVRSVFKIYEKTRCMRKESRILNYIPREFYKRFSGISKFEYQLRPEYQTRVKMGLRDLELHKKVRGSKKWERVTLPAYLDPLELDWSPPQPISTSPPPGRPGHGQRERESTGSQAGTSSPILSKSSMKTNSQN